MPVVPTPVLDLEDGIPQGLRVRDDFLGEGGWSIVHRGDISGGRVAVKTFNAQVLKDVDENVQQHRFSKEVNSLKALGARTMAPPVSGLNGFPDCPGGDFFVKLLGYSKSEGRPGPARDGRFYTILELGEERLDQWLSKTKKSMPKVWAHTGFADVARALFSALHHLHTRGLVHLDIKPENIMRFGTCWKLIDLECCMQIDAGTFVSIDDITPLYASPELAEAVIAAYNVGATTLLPPTSAMDIWAAGVVLLDVLAEGCCFSEMKASFDLAALFEEEAFLNESWYRWLSSSEPLDFWSLLGSCTALDGQLEQFLNLILAKEPALRQSARQLRDHELLQVPQDKGRQVVERVFSSAGREREHLPLYSRNMLMEVLVGIGVSAKDAESVLDALCKHLGCDDFSYTSFLNFLYHA